MGRKSGVQMVVLIRGVLIFAGGWGCWWGGGNWPRAQRFILLVPCPPTDLNVGANPPAQRRTSATALLQSAISRLKPARVAASPSTSAPAGASAATLNYGLFSRFPLYWGG